METGYRHYPLMAFMPMKDIHLAMAQARFPRMLLEAGPSRRKAFLVTSDHV